MLGGVILLCLVGVISAGGLFGLSLLPVDTTATSQMQITLGAQIQSTAAAQSTQVSAQNTRTASGVLNPPPALPNRPAGLPTWPQVNTRAYDEPQSGWESGQDTTSKFFNTIEAVIQTDQLIYQLEPKTGDVYWFTSNKRLTAGENFIFSASLKQASGANDSWQGLIFRQKDAQNFYLFGVSDAGQFGVWRYLGGKWEAVEQPTSIAAVQAGATHNLLVYAQGQMFKMYIENEKVAEAVLQDFSEGFIGFYFEFKTPTAAKFEITNVILQAP